MSVMQEDLVRLARRSLCRVQITVTHLNGVKGYTLFFHKGPRLIDVQFHSEGSERKIRAMFEPGPSIPWGSLRREGVAEFYGEMRHDF